jgi:hypothetical protein
MPYCYKPKIADIPKFGMLGQFFMENAKLTPLKAGHH